MSYILEALKRADAERERGGVPTLRSHAAPMAAAPVARPAARVWIAALAAAVLLLLGALWWVLMRPAAPVTVIAQAPGPVPVAPAPVPATITAPPATSSTPSAPVQTTPSRPAVAAPRAPAPAARASAALPAQATRATPPRPAISAVAAAPAVADNRVLSVAELPEDVRQQLPKLAISGGTYSAQAAYRMLIVNGQVLHENDEPAPGLTLETIRQKDVVLRYKGYRYSVGY